jgi:SAM-dependent methyltransferase
MYATGATEHDHIVHEARRRAMSFEQVMGTVQGMLTATDALAAVAARLSLGSGGSEVDADIGAGLEAVWAAAGLPDLESLAPPQQAMVLAIIRLYFAQAEDLMREPGRAPGWTYTDPLVLEGFGRGSMMVPTMLAADPDLARVTSLLDVGTGIGLLAVSAANVWPEATIVGIDVWEPALERARANVRDAGLESRITLRNQDVAAIDDVDAFDCAWVPTFFLSEKTLAEATPKLARALRRGGWIVCGVFSPPPNPLARTTTELRTTRSGGYNLDDERAVELLDGAGFTDIHTMTPTGPSPLKYIVGRKP